MNTSNKKIAYDFIVVGAGGTGSYFLKEFARYLSSSTEMIRLISHVSVVDGDTIEEKNLSRQCYFEDEIGSNKSIAFCQMVKESFGLDFTAWPQYLNTVQELTDIIQYGSSDITNRPGFSSYTVVPVLLACVDNVPARDILRAKYDSLNYVYFLDAGNGYRNGQCFYACKMDGIEISPDIRFYGFSYEEEEESRSAVSCTQLNLAKPQHILTNMMSASCLLRASILLMETGKVSRGITTFDAFSGILETEPPEKYGFTINAPSAINVAYPRKGKEEL